MSRASRVTELLQRTALEVNGNPVKGSQVKVLRSDAWQFSLSNGRPLQVSARLRGDWLLLSTLACTASGSREDPDEGPAEPERMLGLNRLIDGPAKLVLPAGSTRPELRADLLVDDASLAAQLDGGLNGETLQRLAEACLGLKQGAELIASGGPRDEEPDPEEGKLDEASAGGAVGAEEELLDLCDRAGWEGKSGRDGRLSVPLPTADGLLQARLTRTSRGIRTRVALVEPGTLGEAGHRAVALLLLAVGAGVRLVRGAGGWRKPGELATWAGVESWSAFRAEGLEASLSALTVACELCGREVEALADARLAARYLDLSGNGKHPVHMERARSAKTRTSGKGEAT